MVLLDQDRFEGCFRGGVHKVDVSDMMRHLVKETFPQIIDVAVRGIKQEATLIWLRPSGHAYVRDFAQTWNTPVGMGPFKKCGLILPYSLSPRSMSLSVQDLEEAGKQWEFTLNERDVLFRKTERIDQQKSVSVTRQWEEETA